MVLELDASGVEFRNYGFQGFGIFRFGLWVAGGIESSGPHDCVPTAAAATPGGFHRPNIIVAGRPSLHVLQDTFANGHLVALRDQVSLAMPVEKLAPPRGLAGCQKSFRVYGPWGQGVA